MPKGLEKMTTLRENILHHSPKAVSNLTLAIFFWVAHYIILVILNPINPEQAFLLQTGLIIVSGIFLIKALFNTITIVDHLTKSFLKRLGIKEGLSRERILKDIMYIVAILLIAATLYPILDSLTNYAQILQQITTYSIFGLILLFVFDIARSFYRISEKKANSVANRFSKKINEDKTNE